jgi:pimeloyl-ACP methyl ester carboxylesterase
VPYETVNDVRLYYTDTRDGTDNTSCPDQPPNDRILLVHGWGGEHSEWGPCVGPLSKRHRVVTVDLRGHGRSAVPPDGYGPRVFAMDLAELIGRLGIAPVVAVGHSMGGQVVTALAVEHPDLIRGVVTLDPAYGADAEEEKDIPNRLALLQTPQANAFAVDFVRGAFGAELGQEARERHLKLMAAMPPHVLAQCYAGMYTEPDSFGVRAASERYLARRTCPVLAVCSWPPAADWQRSFLPAARTRVLTWEGAGHYVHEERPSDLVRVIFEWLEGLSR